METPVFVKNDPWLQPFEEPIKRRIEHFQSTLDYLSGIFGDLYQMAGGFNYYGLHEEDNFYRLREWAPNATQIFLVGDFNHWQCNDKYKFERKDNGNWEVLISKEELKHGALFKLHLFWDGGEGMRLPSYINRVVQDEETKLFSAQVWKPKEEFKWEDDDFKPDVNPLLIYEGACRNVL